MKKLLLFPLFILAIQGCAILNEMAALTECEFSLHSAVDPEVAGVDIASKQSFSDLTFMEGQAVVANILQGTLPFSITVNVEARNPGTMTAAVHAIEWIAFIDDVRVAGGTLRERVEVPPAGGRSLIPIRVVTDLFDYLEGDNPRTMANFALNLVDAGNQPTRLSMQIKPSVSVAGQTLVYPGYFTLTREFRSGN